MPERRQKAADPGCEEQNRVHPDTARASVRPDQINDCENQREGREYHAADE